MSPWCKIDLTTLIPKFKMTRVTCLYNNNLNLPISGILTTHSIYSRRWGPFSLSNILTYSADE